MSEPGPASAPEPAGGGRERRASRRRCKHIQVWVRPVDGPEAPGLGWMLDRSLGGCRLSMAQTVPLGTRLSIRAAGASAQEASVLVEVTNRRRLDDCWELGCRFLDEPTYRALLQFG